MKNIFLKSPVIALQHIKNSAWATEKLYGKDMCKKRLFTRNLHYNYDGHASTIFTLCLDEIQGSKKYSGTWLHLARLHSGIGFCTLCSCFPTKCYNSPTKMLGLPPKSH